MGAVTKNTLVLRGETDLGAKFNKALRLNMPYAGLIYVEALINSGSGEVVDIVLPDPTKNYHDLILRNLDGSPKQSISHQVTRHVLATIICSAHEDGKILGVNCREEISKQARKNLKTCVEQSNHLPPQMAA